MEGSVIVKRNIVGCCSGEVQLCGVLRGINCLGVGHEVQTALGSLLLVQVSRRSRKDPDELRGCVGDACPCAV